MSEIVKFSWHFFLFYGEKMENDKKLFSVKKKSLKKILGDLQC